ncbi:MAG: indole-3-glycerol-phosphate synthase [Firmicutes bacterium]|nr:indole-3-glycerol-phosphate synthase [Bacillota bacterium]
MNITSKTIIDFKPISPMFGDLFGDRDPIAVAKHLEQKGILGISVVTREQDFGGSIDLLRRLRKAVRLPILRKDFVTCENDLHITKEYCAEGILLICSLTPNIDKLYEKSLSLGLKPVVEVHTEKEMHLAKKLGAKIIGINNKDITGLEKDNGTTTRTLELIKLAPKDSFVISESGIQNNTDAQAVLEAGANAVLIGTAFWKGNLKI